LLVRAEPAQPVPRLNHDDGAGVEPAILGSVDQQPEFAVRAMGSCVSRFAAIREHFFAGCEIVPGAERAVLAVLPIFGIASGLLVAREAGIADGDSTGGGHEMRSIRAF